MVVTAYASFRLRGEGLDAQRVTRELGLEPSFAHNKGDPRGRGSGIYPIGIWGISSEDRVEGSDLDQHLRFLLDLLDPVTTRLRRVSDESSLQSDFFCFVAFDGQGGPSLTPKTMARIAALDSELGLDLYYLRDDE